MDRPRILSRSPRAPRGVGADRRPPCAHLGARAPSLGLLLAALVGAGCADEARPTAVARRALGEAEGPRRIALRLPAEQTRRDAEVVVRASWGAAPGQLGKREEASRPGPSALAIGPAGEILVLDGVNRRICRHTREGRLAELIPIESEAAEDLVVVGDRIWVLSYQPGSDHGYWLSEHRGGAQLRSFRLPRELELVTGLFALGEDLYVEERHEEGLLVVRGGAPVGESRSRHARLLGRPDPSRPGTRLLLGREGRRATVARVYPGRFTSPLLEVDSPLPVVAFEELLTDGRGGLHLSLFLAEPAEDGDWRDPRRVLLSVAPGAPARTIALATVRATDTRRPVAVGPDGTVHELELAEEGVTIRRWPAERGGAR